MRAKTLTLDGTTVTGSTITDSGTVKVDATKTLNLSGVDADGRRDHQSRHARHHRRQQLNSDALANTQLTVDASKTLTLNGTTITGGTVTDDGTIDVTGDERDQQRRRSTAARSTVEAARR